MWNYHPDLLRVPVPRYTSYPTAADFGEVHPDAFAQALDRTRGDVSLYVHIPFCEKICFYCGCNTAAAGKRSRLKSYLAALHREIELVGQRLPRSVRVGRIAFGGGSPNAITPGEFGDLVDALARHFRLDHPVSSIEIDPRTMTREWADAIGQTGIERASLGVQTFAPHCQSAIGRVQSEDTIMRTVDWLRDAGVSSLNFDLMYGLPGQSSEDLIDSLHRTRVLGADRIALFGYAHVPHIVLRQRAIDGDALPGQEERFAMAAQGYAYLCTHGYMPVGFDHFAKPGGDPLARATTAGLLRRNFQGFTDDPSDVLIGLGSSAISSFPDLLVQNEKNSGRYRMMLSQGQLPASHGIVRNVEDQARGDLIERLLCQGHAHVPDRIMQDVLGSLAPFVERALASISDNYLTICPDGLPYARTIAALFDTYRVEPARRFSAAV
ncbi:radical SAM protein [Parerythrobacter jejuensis]|uniref:Coproporphyrinogen-III oxidase n=1 Tax=Parerythrobacter jejuensis TaxID=795812 RepID=A0A845AVT2_9SPHN|nr:radical SAM protein [Parerythrobacter jejuensis]MXP30627.1 coproporphyrinogen dehydrogenase [Parerythrobacter jejuensis]MXP33387.1 coproporphyrinogen dehydrogenase [Parerythrobacter jejuensis]